jgi:hypothetical protein
MMHTQTPSMISTSVPAPDLRVIGTGFGRTGTTSLREALVRLGFAPCDHMEENFAHPERFVLWREAFQRKQVGEPIDWRPLLADYRAIVDWPGAYFWRELTAAHPEAKVILTLRDPDRWYESTLVTIFNYRTRVHDDDSLSERVRVLLMRLGMLGTSGGLQFIDDLIWQETFVGRFRERAHALRVFSEHNQAVQETIPADKLLIFDVKHGWEPLCQFLGVPIPAGEPFPHLSDASSEQKVIRDLRWDGARRAGAIVASVFLGLLALTWQGGRTQRRERPV